MVTALASTTAADVTGLVAAGVLSLVGFFILPARRRSIRASCPGGAAAGEAGRCPSEELAVPVE